MIGLAILFIFVSAYNEYSFYSLFPFITERFGQTEQEKNDNITFLFLLLSAIHGIGRIIGFAVWKYFDIKVKAKHLITICFGLSSLTYILYGFSVNIYMLAISRLIIGMIYSNDEILKKYLREACKTSKVNMYTIIMGVVEKVGSISGLLLGSHLYDYGFDKFPLLTLGIVSAAIMLILFVVNCIHAKRIISINCDFTCCNLVGQDGSFTFYSDSDDDEIGTRTGQDRENIHNDVHRQQIDDHLNDSTGAHEFIASIVSFSSLYNMYRYIVILYLFFNQYDVTTIGNILAVVEAAGLVFDTVLAKISPYVENVCAYSLIHMILMGVIVFFPFITDVTAQLSNTQIAVIVAICCVVEISFRMVLAFNNAVLKTFRLNETKWKIYSMSTVFTNILSILFITAMTPLIKYTNANELKKYVIDRHTPFYVTAILYLFSLVFLLCNIRKIIRMPNTA